MHLSLKYKHVFVKHLTANSCYEQIMYTICSMFFSNTMHTHSTVSDNFFFTQKNEWLWQKKNREKVCYAYTECEFSFYYLWNS